MGRNPYETSRKSASKTPHPEPPGRAPSQYPKDAYRHPVSGSPDAAPAPDDKSLREDPAGAHRASARLRRTPRRPGSHDRPRPHPCSRAPAPTPPTGRHPGGHGRTGRGNDAPQTAWPQSIACVEVLAPSQETRGPPHRPRNPLDRRAKARRGCWTGPGPSCPDAYPLPKHDQSEGPSLPARYVARRSPVLRPPRTPAALQRTSPSAYTSGLCPTQGVRRRVSPVPAQTFNACHLPYPGETRRADPGPGLAGHGLHRDMSGSALPLSV